MFQAEDGIRDLVRSRGLGDVYKRQLIDRMPERSSDFSKISVTIFCQMESGFFQLRVKYLSLIHI